jgi:transposase
MDTTTVGVDLAKHRFELAVADGAYRIQRRARLSRSQFARFFGNQPPSLVVMEACGSAHHWARSLQAQGHQVRLLPAQYVRAYVKRNKTDAADAGALLEAARCGEIRPVPVKSIEQQAIQQLHRLRAQCMGTRTARINWLRGALREFGISIPLGAQCGIRAVREALATPSEPVPAALRAMIEATLAEIAALAARSTDIERQFAALTSDDAVVRELRGIPGIGLLSATALRAAIVDIQRFGSGRQLAS